MFENIVKFFKKLTKSEQAEESSSKNMAKERLHLVLMQDRANVSADFLELMKQEIIEVIKKYIEVDESAIDVRLTNKTNEEGETGAPALYANIPILNIKNDMKKIDPSNNTGTEAKKLDVDADTNVGGADHSDPKEKQTKKPDADADTNIGVATQIDPNKKEEKENTKEEQTENKETETEEEKPEETKTTEFVE